MESVGEPRPTPVTMRLSAYLGIFFVCLLLSGCDSDSGDPSSVPPQPDPPRLAFSPDTLFFTLPGDTPVAAPAVAKYIEIRNAGDGSLEWILSENLPWLVLSADSGTAGTEADTIEARTDFGVIAAGSTVEGSITVTAGGEVDSIRAIATNDIEQIICVSQTRLNVIAEIDSGPAVLDIRACGNWEADWTVTSDPYWMDISPRSGASAGEWDRVTITVDWTDIAGPRLGKFKVNGPTNSIQVELQVSFPLKQLCVDRNGYWMPDNTNPGPVNFRVANCGEGPGIDWTASVDQPWVSLSDTAGSAGNWGAGEWDSVYVTVDWDTDWTVVSNFRAYITVAANTFAGPQTHVMPLTVSPNCLLEFTEPSAATRWTAGD